MSPTELLICAGRGPGQCSQEADVYNDHAGESHRKGLGRWENATAKNQVRQVGSGSPGALWGLAARPPALRGSLRMGEQEGLLPWGQALVKEGLLGLQTQDACVYMLGRRLLARSLSSR